MSPACFGEPPRRAVSRPGYRCRGVTSRRLYMRGSRVHFLEAGHGPAVLLVHGDGGCADDWLPVMRQLAREHRVIAVDLPGYGGSSPIGRVTPAASAVFLWRFAEAVSVRCPVLVGHSLGGAIALHMALRWPDRVPALGLVSPLGMGRAVNPHLLQVANPLLDLTLLAPILPLGPQVLTALTAAEGSSRPWRLPASWWRSQLRTASSPTALRTTVRTTRAVIGPAGQRELLVHRLSELPMPTLVVWGEDDEVLPVSQAYAAAGHLRRGRLALLPRCGHLVADEAGDRLSRVLREFFDHAGTRRTAHGCRGRPAP